MSRPRKDKERKYLLTLVAQGMSVCAASKLSNVTRASVTQWKQRDSAYAQKLAAAQVQGKIARKSAKLHSLIETLADLQKVST